MTNDLHAMNVRLVEHWIGTLNAEQAEYVEHANVCFAQLASSTAALQRRLKHFQRLNRSAPRVVELNRSYLRFARLAAKDALSGRPDMLVRLAMTFEQARFLCDLTDEDIELIALGWKRPIMRFPHLAFRRGARLQRLAGRLHAASFAAARPDAPKKERS